MPIQALPLRFIDLGCGTGRATMALQEALQDVVNTDRFQRLISHCERPASETTNIEIKGLDASEGMLKVAKGRVPSLRTFELLIMAMMLALSERSQQ